MKNNENNKWLEAGCIEEPPEFFISDEAYDYLIKLIIEFEGDENETK